MGEKVKAKYRGAANNAHGWEVGKTYDIELRELNSGMVQVVTATGRETYSTPLKPLHHSWNVQFS